MEKLQAPSRTQQTDSSPNLSLEAAKCAKLILGSYRTGDANDPDTYVRVIAAVLTCYPVEIMKEVSDPRWGIATKIKWLPTLYDVKEACEAAMQPTYRRQREEAHIAERRQRLSAPTAPRPTLAELQAKYGENWGLQGNDANERAIKESKIATTERANQRLLSREYAAAGIEPVHAGSGIPVSLALARKIAGKTLGPSK
jgi:hypothetical protein